jgi:hypothetical protein
MARMRGLVGWVFGAVALVAVVLVVWRVLPTAPRASGEPPATRDGPLSACHGVEGQMFSIADGATGQATPEEAIAATVGFPAGTPTENYQALPPTNMGTIIAGREPVSYVHHQSNGKVDALAQVIPLSSGWAVASIAHCTP